MINETDGTWWNVQIDVHDVSTGRVIQREIGHNRVVTAGRNLIRDFLSGDIVTGLEDFGIGAGGDPVLNGNTALGVLLSRHPITRFTKDEARLTVQYYLSTSALNGETIREVGLFTGDDTLYARYVLATPIVKTSSNPVTFTWTLAWTATGMSINIQPGHVIELGGMPDILPRPNTPNVYPSGGTLDKLVPGAGVWYLDSADLDPDSEYVIEGIAKIESAGAVPRFAVFSLEDDPNIPLPGSEVIGSGVTTGERLRSSTITFPTGGDSRTLGVKATTNNVAKGVAVYGLRFLRVA
jgi:hypothetical protein